MRTRLSGRALDQVLNSASSAVFSLGLVAATDDATLGAIAIQLTALPLLLGLARTSVFEGVLFRATESERGGLAWLPAATGLAMGTLAFAVSLVLGLLLDLSSGIAIATAVAAFAVLWFDGLRFAAFTIDEDHVAVIADLCWLVISTTGMAVMITGHGLDPAALAWWYGGAAVASSVVFVPLIRRVRRRPVPAHVRSDFKFGFDFLLQVLPGQLTLVLASLVTSLGAVGILRAAVTVYSPLATVIYAVRLTLIDGSRTDPRQWFARSGGIYATVSVAYGAAIVVGFYAVPQVTSQLLGSIPTDVLVLVGVGEVARHVTQSVVDYVRVLGRLRKAIALRASQAVSLVAFSVVLAALWDAFGLSLARALAFGLPAMVAVVLAALTTNPSTQRSQPTGDAQRT